MSSSNVLQRPEWMSDSFFEKALKSTKGDNVAVISSVVGAATSAGENYGSEMFRANLKFRRGTETEEISIIVKASLPKSRGVVAETLLKSKVFDMETYMFVNVLPAMYSLLKEHLSAQYLYSHADDAVCSIVLEDLKVQGFRLAELNSGLDLKHCLLVMRGIAHYHAASLVLYGKDPAIFQPFMEKLPYEDMAVVVEGFFSSNMTTVAREVETWPDYKDRFAEKLHKLARGTLQKLHETQLRKDGDLNVLCHCDLWAGNLMFRYSEDSGEVEEVRLLDFQLPYWTSPAIDLHNFLHTSASAEALEQSDMLIEEYYNTFCGDLTSLKYSHLKPTLAQLIEELEKKSFQAIFSATVYRSMTLASKEKPSDIDNLVDDTASVYLTEAYKKSLMMLLDKFETKGWL